MDRVVEIECAVSKKPKERGTGYVVAPGVVLTVRHVVEQAAAKPERVRVRRASSCRDEDWVRAREVVLPHNPLLETTLLLLDGEDWTGGGVEIPGLVDVAAPVPFHACGFPAVYRNRNSGERNTDNALGDLRPDVLTRSQETVLVLDVTSPVPAARQLSALIHDTEAVSGWSGISGAAVFGPGGLLVGVVTETKVDYLDTRLHAEPITSALADPRLAPHLPPVWRERDTPRVANQLTISVGAELRVLLEGPGRAWRADEPIIVRPTALLTASSETVPFIPREEPQTRLRTWCDEPADVSYTVLSGGGGVGKSRLANDLCAAMAARGWVSGIVRSLRGATADLALEQLGRPALLVVDYADHLQDIVAELLRSVATRTSHKIRILAVVRDGEAFLRRFAVEMDNAEVAHRQQQEIALGRTPLSPEERQLHYRVATDAFSRSLGLETSGDVAEADLSARLATMPTPLLVHARALLDLLDRATAEPGSVVGDTATDVLKALLVREDRRYWRKLLAGLIETERIRRRVFAVSTLVGAESETEALNALEAVDGAEVADETARRRVLERIQDHFRDEERLLPFVEPDLLGEQLIADTVLARSGVGHVFDRVTSDGQRSRALEVLLRMCESPIGTVGEAAHDALATLLDERLDTLVEQAIALTTPEGGPVKADARQFPSRLAACVERAGDPAVAARVAASVEFPMRLSLQPLAAAVYRGAADHAAAQSDYQRAAELATRAATALSAVGQYTAAEGPLDLAMTYLGSAPSFTGGSSPELARILSTGSIVSLGAERLGLALRDATRAVEMVESLAALEPGRHTESLNESRMALIMASLAAGLRPEADELVRRSLAETGRLEPAARARLTVLGSAVRQATGDLDGAAELVAEGIAAISEHEADGCPREMAAMWIMQSTLQAMLGRLDEARVSAARAEEYAARIAGTGLDEAVFVLAQIRLGAATVALADEDALEALDLAERACLDLARLYRESETLYGFYYVLGESIQSRALSAAGYSPDAKTSARRGRKAALAGFAAQPATYLAGLVDSAIAEANAYAVDGDFAGASRVVEETLTAIGRLDESMAPSAREMSALLLRVLADVEAAAEEPGDHTSAARRAVEAYSVLVASRGEAVQIMQLIGARLLHTKALVSAHRPDEALAEAARALADAEQLVAEAPNDQSRRILVFTRVVVADGYDDQDDNARARELLGTAMREYVLDHDTRADVEMREEMRKELRRLESEGRAVVGESAPPTTFTELEPGTNRVVLGRFRDTEVAAREFRPVLVLGPQRSRKTTSLIIPTLLEWDGPALVTSVRADVVMGTARRRSRMGEVSIFEPTGSLFAGGPRQTTWNPVEGCEDWETAVRMAHALMESGRGTGEGNGIKDERFWYSQAALLLQPLLHAAGLSRLTMEEVSRWLRTEARAEVLARLQISPKREPADIFSAFSRMAEVTRSGVYATARDVMRVYESEAVRKSSRSGFSIDEFFDGRANTLYLCAPPEEQERLAPVFTALVRAVITQAYRWQHEPLKLLLLLDEAGNIAKIEDLDTVATTAAGTGIQLVTVFHDVSQIEALYNVAKADSLVNNHSALLVLPGTRDAGTMALVDRIFSDERRRGIQRRSVRQLKPGTALCVYEHLPIEEIELRSSSHDLDLIEYARDGRPDDDISDLVVRGGRS